MQPEICAHKQRSSGKRGMPDMAVEPDVGATLETGDAVSGVLGVSSGGGGTTPAPQMGNTGAAGIVEQPDSQPTQVADPINSSNSLSAGLRYITADRPIFTLSVAADLLGLHPRTLRIYEEKGLVVPARTEGNRRRYSQADIEKFQAIRLLTRGGVNLEGVRIILDMAQELSRLGSDPTAIIERNLQTSAEC